MRGNKVCIVLVTIAACGNVDTSQTGVAVEANGGLTGDGTDDRPLALAFDGPGSAAAAARADHDHDGRYLPFGASLRCSGTDKMSGIDDDGNAVCMPDAEPTYSAGDGLALSGTTFAVAAGGIRPAHLAGPARLYHRVMSPRWLEGNATFPTRAPTITDNTVGFGAGAAADEKLLEVALLPAGALEDAASYVVRILVGQLPPTGDNDPLFAVTDGTTVIGVAKLDAANAVSGQAVVATNGTTLGNVVRTDLGGPPGSNGQFEVVLELSPGTSPMTIDALVVLRVGANSGQAPVATTLSKAAPLRLVVHANNAAETYTFLHVEVVIEREGG